jgi:hypothetical protein
MGPAAAAVAAAAAAAAVLKRLEMPCSRELDRAGDGRAVGRSAAGLTVRWYKRSPAVARTIPEALPAGGGVARGGGYVCRGAARGQGVMTVLR